MNSKRRKKRKACDSKQAHKTKHGAITAMNKTLKKHFIFHKMTPYKCKYCDMWHIGRSRDVIYRRFNELK